MAGRRELAPMLTRVWGHLAPIVARLIVERSGIAHRLTLAPSRLIHAAAIYVDWASDAGTPISQIARSLDTADIRDLLPFAIPNPHPQLYGLLGRVGSRVRDQSFYVRLNAALHGPASDFLLRADPIDTAVLDLAEHYGRDPVMFAAQRAIGGYPPRARALASTLAFLRALSVANDIETLPPGSGWPSIRRRVETDLGRLKVPPAPFAIPVGWRQIADVHTLQRLGRRMTNCVAHITGGGIEHYRRLIAGEIVLLVSETPEPLIAEIERIAPCAWRLVNVLGKGNRRAPVDVSSDLTAALSRAMKAVGHALLDGNPIMDLDAVVGYGSGRDDDLRWLEG